MKNNACHLALLHHFTGNGGELFVGVRANGRRSVMMMHTPMHMLDDDVNEAKSIAAGFFTNCGWQIRFYVDNEEEFIAGSMQEFVDNIDAWHLGWMADMTRDLRKGATP